MIWGRSARMGLAFGAALGRLAFAIGFRRRVSLDNLARAFPSLDPAARKRLARDAYAQLGRSLAEIGLVRSVPDAFLEQLVQFDGWERFEAARARGHGVVIAVAHFGNWELLARAGARRNMAVTAITRRLRGNLNRTLVEARREGGLRELPDKGSSAQAVALLRRGETLAIVVDQNMRPRRGIFVDFFGAKACTTPAAAVLALRTGAPLLAAFPTRQPDGSHRVRMLGPFEPPPGAHGHRAVVALTQAVTDAVEAAIRERPDHWFWVHRRWKTRPPPGVEAGIALPTPRRS